MVRFTMRIASASTLTSPWIAVAPTVAAACFSRASSRPEIATRAPRAINALAIS